MTKRIRIVFYYLVSLVVVGNLCAAQSPEDSNQQALQQLRLLQQRMSQATPESPVIGPESATEAPKKETKEATPPQAQSATNEPVVSANDSAIIENKAFNDMVKNLYPLNPEQIVRLRQIYQKSEFAQATTPGTPPKPTATSQFVNLSPGSTPPVIRLSQGFVSSLVFLDSTGAPWPISAYDLGDPGSFNIQWDKTSNTLMIQAIKLYNYGNLAVRLKGLNTPVMLTLIPGQKAVDYRVDLRVQGYGPNAVKMPLEQGIPPSASDLLLHVLDGVPPPLAVAV